MERTICFAFLLYYYLILTSSTTSTKSANYNRKNSFYYKAEALIQQEPNLRKHNHHQHHFYHKNNYLLTPNQQQQQAAAAILPPSSSSAAASSPASWNQCPINRDTISFISTQSQVNQLNEKVLIDELTGRRTFEAKLVGIFSCLDNEDPSSNNDLTLDFRLAKPVIDLAIKKVNLKYNKQIKFNVTYRTAPDICKHQQAAGHAADEYYVNGANYFLGPGCSESLASVGQLASYWNVPMCSTGFLPEFVTQRFNPLTLMQLSLSVQSVGEMLMELFQMYKWRHLVIVTDENHPLHTAIRDGLLEFFHTMYMIAAGGGGSSGGGSALNSRKIANLQQYQQLNINQDESNLYNRNDNNNNRFVRDYHHHQTSSSSSSDSTNNNNDDEENWRLSSTFDSRDDILKSKLSLIESQSGTQSSSSSSSSSKKTNRILSPYYINITSRNFAYGKNNKQIDYEQIMLDAASYSRVMLFLARSKTIDKLLVAAHKQGMSKGQFVFIAHELFESRTFQDDESVTSTMTSEQLRQYRKNQQKFTLNDKIDIKLLSNSTSSAISSSSSSSTTTLLTELNQQQAEKNPSTTANSSTSTTDNNNNNINSRDQLMREIFQPLMTISLRIPTTPELDNFRSEVAGLSEREFNYRMQSLKSIYSLGLAAFIYDCVMLYADKVNFILEKTQFSKIDGKTIFDLSAGKTFHGALTGDLTINRAGQRVIDFTLNDFSPKSLTLEPIAYFMAIESKLTFLPGKQPHWVLKNQSVPRSEPRCRFNDSFCNYKDEADLLDNELLNYNNHLTTINSSDRVVLGVWLLVIIVISVTLTSSIIGFLVYRRFRIESELLNLWWSIRYEDILFEDEADIMCDGKRSLSSLAISNESFNDLSGGGVAATTSGGRGGGGTASSGGGGNSGRASPQQQQQQQQQGGGNQLGLGNSPQRSTTNTIDNLTNNVPGIQLSVSHPLGNNSSNLLHNSINQQETSILSNAQSTSTLSVTAPSIGGGSTSGLAQTPANITISNTNISPSPSSSVVAAAAAAAANNHQQQQNCRLNQNPSININKKLLPLIGNNQRQSNSKQLSANCQLKAANSTSSSAVAGGGGVTTTTTTTTNANKAAAAAGGLKGGITSASNKKDPSISSQNKNVKLKLGTVLKGGRDGSHTTKVGLYKASRVAAKHLNVKNLNINRQLLIELRQVRDLTHENLIKFIGLCPEEPNVAIISELCTRGNLQDLLQNESIRLDWSFRYSIINDIVDGLIHLHSSPIQYHGRLKSSNCVIDNRFVVKLTDFGLPTLLASVELEEEVNPRMLLWTAPEHLRTKHPLLSGSQKGDIYSLAIIFQEIITRCGPFECEPILCGASEVGAPIGVDWSSSSGHQQQQQQQQTLAPLIRTTDAGGNQLSMPVAGRGGQQGARQLRQQQGAGRQPFQATTYIQPIVVQHKQRLEPEEIVNLVRMGLSPPFRPYFRPDVAATTTSGGGAAAAAAGGATNSQAGLFGLLPTNQQNAAAAAAAAAAASGADFNVADLIAVVQNCWQETPALRPTITSIKQQIKKMRRGCHLDGANLMDNLLQRMERYTDNLESLVEQKTAELMEEKKRSEELLYEMLPRFVVDQLKYGHSVTPEAYEAVTISFSDIKDFTSIAAQSSPIEVVNLLNQLYTEFDDCIDRYDVYKVETIGDAYMVVSGLPIRNGDQHAREIAEMSLALLELIRNFDVVHLPHVNLELRIGIHSGPCASGVVGTRMFRYCLFGDTVNTASRMESHGEPMKIHTSEDSANILSRFGTFILEPRGEIEIKGKGLMNTYWLTGRRDNLN